MAGELWAQLDGSYNRGAAVGPLTDPEIWLEAHRTARRRAKRAWRLGYRFVNVRRPERADEIHAINTSTDRRQGRPMSAGYLEPSTYSDPPMDCPIHHVYPYGVLAPDGALAAYLWLYRSADLAMVSSILGHADRLDDGIMYLLWYGMLSRQYVRPGTVFYNLWDSGTDGLRFFKERVGLSRMDVEWTL